MKAYWGSSDSIWSKTRLLMKSLFVRVVVLVPTIELERVRPERLVEMGWQSAVTEVVVVLVQRQA